MIPTVPYDLQQITPSDRHYQVPASLPPPDPKRGSLTLGSYYQCWLNTRSLVPDSSQVRSPKDLHDYPLTVSSNLENGVYEHNFPSTKNWRYIKQQDFDKACGLGSRNAKPWVDPASWAPVMWQMFLDRGPEQAYLDIDGVPDIQTTLTQLYKAIVRRLQVKCEVIGPLYASLSNFRTAKVVNGEIVTLNRNIDKAHVVVPGLVFASRHAQHLFYFQTLQDQIRKDKDKSRQNQNKIPVDATMYECEHLFRVPFAGKPGNKKDPDSKYAGYYCRFFKLFLKDRKIVWEEELEDQVDLANYMARQAEDDVKIYPIVRSEGAKMTWVEKDGEERELGKDAEGAAEWDE